MDLSTVFIKRATDNNFKTIDTDWENEGKCTYNHMCEVVYDSIGTEAPRNNKYTEALKYVFPNIVIPNHIDDASKDTSSIIILYTAITTMKELDKRADVYDRKLLPTRLKNSSFEERQIYSMALTDVYNEHIFKQNSKLPKYEVYFNTYPLYLEDDECSLMFTPTCLKSLSIKQLLHIGNYFEFEAAKKYYQKDTPFYKQKNELIKVFRSTYNSMDRSKSIQMMRNYLLLQNAADVCSLRMAISPTVNKDYTEIYKTRIFEEFNWQCSAITKAKTYIEELANRKNVPRCEMYDDIDLQRH